MRKTTTKNSSSTQKNNHYSKILNLVWNDQSEEALTLLTQTLSQNKVDHETIFFLYRLWIELLSEQKNFAGLKLLINHLRLRNDDEHGTSHEKHSATWASLEALIHLELDEMEAVQAFKARLKNEENSYALEFHTRLSWRKDISYKKQSYPVTHASHKDYWSLKTFALAAELSEEPALMADIFERINALYPNNPLILETNYHRALKDQNFELSQNIANKLCLAFPNVSSHSFLLGHAYFMDKKFPEAIESLKKAGDKIFEDPDILASLGYCHFYQSKIEKYEENWGQAIEFYSKAQALYKDMNIPTAEIDLTLDFLSKKAEVKDFSKTKKQNFWLASLSSKNSYDLLSTPKQDNEYLFRQVDKKTLPGDMFIFVEKPAQSSPHHYKIVGTYLAVTAPSYDPMKGWVSPLQLKTLRQKRLSVKIEIAENERKIRFATKSVLELKKDEVEKIFKVLEKKDSHLDDFWPESSQQEGTQRVLVLRKA